MDRLGALLTAQRWSIANAINNAISAAATAQAMPIMIRFIILTTFANPTGYARLTLQRSRSERVACEFSGLTLPFTCGTRVNDSSEREGRARAARCRQVQRPVRRRP
jgi:hypothetical protein